MQWLIGLFNFWLPTLPLSGVWANFTALWEVPILGPLPNPKSPLPWQIGIEPDWSMPISGVRLIPAAISILVTQTGGSPSSVEVSLAKPSRAKRRPPRNRRITATQKKSKKENKKQTSSMTTQTPTNPIKQRRTP